jgi:hypothetical protein
MGSNSHTVERILNLDNCPKNKDHFYHFSPYLNSICHILTSLASCGALEIYCTANLRSTLQMPFTYET